MKIVAGKIAGAFGFVMLASWTYALQTTPTYFYTVQDAVTGDNFVPDKGWYVTPGADDYQNDFMRERPLDTNGFTYDSGSGQWVHGGKYYAYLDIVTGQWGYDEQYLYFSQTLYGNWSQGSATSDRDYGEFGSGTLYNIILGMDPEGEANGSILLRSTGDYKESWTGATTGDFHAKGTQGWYDKDGDVGGTGVSVTKEDGDEAGTGYESEVIKSDGYLEVNGKQEVLFRRVTGAQGTDNAMPIVEIALDYLLWNQYAELLGLPFITPEDISFIVFEANRGIKENANYLWNDKYTQEQEGSPYDVNGITQLGNVYEVDRVYWTRSTAVPDTGTTIFLLGLGILGLASLKKKLTSRYA